MRYVLFSIAVLLAPAASAAPEPGEHGVHGSDAAPAGGHEAGGHEAGGHEAGGHEGGAEGGGGAHHLTYSDDSDGDGVPNWRDPTAGAEANPAYVIPSLGWHFLNFSILVGILVYAARRPVLDTFRDRALGIKTELTESARRRDEAHQRHQELLARLDKIEGEVAAMEREAVVEAEREEQKLVERANREAVRIGEQAERNIRDEAMRARIELRREAVELAVQLARGTLEGAVDSKDQQALARAFLQSVEGVNRV